MSDALKVVLTGIILILSSLFFMGVCIINSQKGGPQGLTVSLFAAGVIVSFIGLFFIKEDNKEDNEDEEERRT